MKVIKKTSEYTVYQKRSGRYAVVGAGKKAINGDEKTKILLAEELIKVSVAAEPEPEVVEEVEEAAEESTEETAEASEEPEAAAEEPAAEEEEAPKE